MKYLPNFSAWTPVFAVPCAIADNHIKLLSGIALKAMLLMLRHNGAISSEEIASILSQSVGDINDAISELVRCGLIVPHSDSSCVTENNPPTIVNTNISPVTTTPVVTIPTVSTPPVVPVPTTATTTTPTKIALSKPTLSRSEAHTMINADKNLEQLIHEAQNIKGDTLSSAEISTLVSLYSYYGLACDFILMVMQYCRSINKFSMGYIEKTISSWVDMGVDNHEKAEQHIVSLSEFKKRENQIRSAFGIGERVLVDKERAFIKSWFEVLSYDMPMIKFAFEKTIENTGKLSFAYTNKILTSWHEKGFKTPKEASLEQRTTENFTAQQQVSASPKHAPSRKASYDISELEELIYSGYKEEKK